jgi:hypothetical protein
MNPKESSRSARKCTEVFDILPFKVSPSQVISLKTFDFVELSMAEVDTGVLPFSIIPPEATSISSSRALSINNSQTETYGPSGEPTFGALSTADTQCLGNQNGYLPASRMEAQTQIFCTLALLGALCGTEHPLLTGWWSMLRQYERVDARLQHKIDTEVGAHLALALFIFHLQLILRDWFVEQTRTGHRMTVPAPNLSTKTT